MINKETKAGSGKTVKLSKQTVNIIRTTQRNNIELTHIADNKANVLLSLNAIMITFLIPLILPNIEVILSRALFVPLTILATTCFTTIYLAAMVLKPANFDNFRDDTDPNFKSSPFFFGNFYKMQSNEFYDYIEDSLAKNGMIKTHLTQDLYYLGRRLGQKMTWIRRTFNIFLTGLFLSLFSLIIVLVVY